MSATKAIEPSRGRPWLSATSSTSGFKSISSRRGSSSVTRPNFSDALQNVMARSSVAMSFGTKR